MRKPPLTREISKRIAKRMEKRLDKDIVVLLEMCDWYEEQLIFAGLRSYSNKIREGAERIYKQGI